ncbi:hypothetical protein QMK19_38600 [Streptomyces sp. H10-C2]|nr:MULTISPECIES: hypothetical protein [unclassified Streptomyces]MDJ0346825.1 hypothetical protein [Streptomyces sp. PH10-H1]MDJ0375350.1 hypothetical protein [Streptomyces sp. H10-C2]
MVKQEPQYIAQQVGPYDWEIWDDETERWVPSWGGNLDVAETAAEQLNGG